MEVLLDEIDLGEAETIVLARELGADWVLMDEKKGRRKLTEMGLPKIGTVGILLKAKQVGLLTPFDRIWNSCINVGSVSAKQSLMRCYVKQMNNHYRKPDQQALLTETLITLGHAGWVRGGSQRGEEPFFQKHTWGRLTFRWWVSPPAARPSKPTTLLLASRCESFVERNASLADVSIE